MTSERDYRFYYRQAREAGGTDREAHEYAVEKTAPESTPAWATDSATVVPWSLGF